MKNTKRKLFNFCLLLSAFAVTDNISAQTFSLEGKWETRFNIGGISCVAETEYFPTGSYNASSRCASNVFSTSGKYILKNRLLSQTVEDWEPKSLWKVDLCPEDSSRPGCGHLEPIQKPADIIAEITVINANKVKVRDVNSSMEIVSTRLK